VVISPVNGGIGLQGQNAVVSATNNLKLVNTSIGVSGDLSLLGEKSVLIRDSVETPFLAVSGKDLLIEGNEIDIFAINNPQSALISGGDMTIKSTNSTIGDAHYFSGGNFSIQDRQGNLGKFKSEKDPIIRASGDVSFDFYQGTSLHIIAGGSVTADTIQIDGATIGENGVDFIQETITLSDGTIVEIDGSQQATLDIRAGVTPEFIGTPNITGLGIFDFILPSPDVNLPPTGADINLNYCAI